MPANDLIAIPDGLPVDEAVFLPNMETGVNLVMDGKPLLGERVVVIGQGIVGLLTTALLARFPIASLVTLDRFPLRRETSVRLGARSSLDPGLAEVTEQAETLLGGKADLVFELSGSPAALDQAIALTGFDGRVVIGSWYGEKRASLNLGGWFHRSRIRLISSQVSSLAPEFSGRWDKARRLQSAWELLNQVCPSGLITHRYPIHQAAEAYRMLDQDPSGAIQVIFTYDSESSEA